MIQTAAPSIADPVAIGTEITVGPVTLRVEQAIVADGTATVANTNAQSDAPPDGLAYVLANVTVRNNGQDMLALSATDFATTATDGVLRRCPSVALPDPPFNVALAPSEIFSGWTGGLVNDVSNVVMIFDPAISAGTRFAGVFALTDGAALPALDTAAVEPSDVGSSIDAPAGLGETVRTELWELTVNDSIGVGTYYDISDYRVGALGAPDADGWGSLGSALGLDLTIRNISGSPQFFSWTALELIDTNGEPWDHLLAMTQPLPPASIELLPGATANGWYGILVQPWATTSLLRFRDSILTDDFRFISLDGTSGSAQQAEAESQSAEAAEPAEPLDIAPGDIVEVGGDPLNLRSDAMTDGDLVMELAPGTQLAITGDVIEADGYRWRQVEVVETGESGFIVEDFITPIGQ